MHARMNGILSNHLMTVRDPYAKVIFNIILVQSLITTHNEMNETNIEKIKLVRKRVSIKKHELLNPFLTPQGRSNR